MNARRARWHGKGLAAVEFAMVLPVLLLIFFGIVDLGRAVLTRQILTNLSREAANLASRGTSLADTLAAIQISAAPLDLAANGKLIVTEVLRDTNGQLKVYAQLTSGGLSNPSRVGQGIGNAAQLPPASPPVPPNGQTLMAAEVFYHSAALTPLGTLLNSVIGDVLYDAAYF